MVHFDKQILGKVVVEQVSRDARALRHPIEPQPARRAVDVVAADFGVNRAVELDARHLRAGEQPAHMNVMDGVAGNDAEGPA